MTKTSSSGRGDLLRALIFIPLGLCLLCLTVWLVEDRLGFLAQAQRAQGHVSALNSGGSHPQIDFTDATGKAVSYPESGFIFGYAVGDSVTVFYNAEAPSSTAIIEDQGALWGASLFSGLLAIVFIAGGGYHAAAWIRRRRMTRPI
ncbi:DUF3592 domain-containing protein [Pseudomonas quasicaspiana]|uniref:DUF3592 domain-containing protein n=1 Tax=Pseudomonas quasicaspiana TaxID=2829821 RepID=UPI001E43FA1F|nr:DUF3592 domain-containing protein [Pseudomonas quasicaspiana]MCD5971174.1 DUF3592 domain-containing protein [Pseudomonas quasicaspiana]